MNSLTHIISPTVHGKTTEDKFASLDRTLKHICNAINHLAEKVNTPAYVNVSITNLPGSLIIGIVTDGVGDFLTRDTTGTVRYRTPAETLTDIGGVGGTGTTNKVPKFTASGTIGNSLITDDGTNATVNEMLTVNNIPALATAASIFLTAVAGQVQSRTVAQVVSDIGALVNVGNIIYLSGNASTLGSWRFRIGNDSDGVPNSLVLERNDTVVGTFVQKWAWNP